MPKTEAMSTEMHVDRVWTSARSRTPERGAKSWQNDVRVVAWPPQVVRQGRTVVVATSPTTAALGAPPLYAFVLFRSNRELRALECPAIIGLKLRGGGCSGSKARQDEVPVLGQTARDRAPVTLGAAPTSALTAEMLTALTSLDDRLVETLGEGHVRLVRVKWLLAQPLEFRLVRRQELEALEVGAVLSPLLTPDEAVALVRKGGRGVGVASHPWLSAGDPDPAGERVRLLRRALEERPYIEALFFDFPSLFQHERSEAQNAAFKRALSVVSTCRHTTPPLTLTPTPDCDPHHNRHPFVSLYSCTPTPQPSPCSPKP